MIQKWRVQEFCERTLVGRVKRGKRVRIFLWVCFHASTFRRPRVGEQVDCVFTRRGQLLAVHGA